MGNVMKEQPAHSRILSASATPLCRPNPVQILALQPRMEARRLQCPDGWTDACTGLSSSTGAGRRQNQGGSHRQVQECHLAAAGSTERRPSGNCCNAPD